MHDSRHDENRLVHESVAQICRIPKNTPQIKFKQHEQFMYRNKCAARAGELATCRSVDEDTNYLDNAAYKLSCFNSVRPIQCGRSTGHFITLFKSPLK